MKKSRFFEIYIVRILKHITIEKEPNVYSITLNAKQQLNSVMCLLARILSEKMLYLMQISEKKTLTIKEVQNACKIVCSKKMSEEIIDYGEKIITQFSLSNSDMKNTRNFVQKKAQLLIPPSLVEKFMRNFDYNNVSVSKLAPIFFASILEYICIIILTFSCQNSTKFDRLRLTVRDLEIAVQKNSDLKILFQRNHLSFLGGGVLPKIQEYLLNKNGKSKKDKFNQAISAISPSKYIQENPVKLFLGKKKDWKKSHRFRPGTVALREIKKMQKISEHLILPKIPFQNLVRRLLKKYREHMKISKDVFIFLQYYIEQFLVHTLHDANLLSVYAKRTKLSSDDIDFILKLRGIYYDEI
jgi:histone H3